MPRGRAPTSVRQTRSCSGSGEAGSCLRVASGWPGGMGSHVLELGGGDRAGTDRRPKLGYMPALDGARAVALAAVLLFHSGVAWARGGYLGVTGFFVLSGVLVTSLLMVE